jgi:arylsulfatase A-like enzyme
MRTRMGSSRSKHRKTCKIKMTRKPNILLITTDQMRFDHLGLMGVKGIATPNLDRLGREGFHFNRGYTSSPVCTPARLTLLTGQYPSSHGGYTIGVSPDPFPERTLPKILGESGYATALIGKAHFVRRALEAEHVAGFPHPPVSFFATHAGPYAGFDYVQLATHHTTNGAPECHYHAWLESQGVDYSKWFPDVHGRHDHAQTGAWNIPVEYHDSTWITDTTLDWLGKRNKDGDPWFAWASYNDPHEPFVCPEPWYSSVRMEEVELFEEYREGEFEDKPPFYQSVYEQDRWDRDYKNEVDIDVPCAFARRDLDGKHCEALQATLGMVAMLDHEVGRLLDALEAAGQADNTLIVFTTDHGEIHGHHGLWHKGLFAYEDCQRIPFLAWGPGIVKPTGASEALVNLVDLPRTFLSLANLPIPQGMQGEDLRPVLTGKKESVQNETLVELQATKKIYQQSLITERYKLIVYRDQDYGELYDLRDDPDQYRNLWGNPDAAAIKTDLMHRFIQFNMKKEGHVHDRQAFA